MRKEASSAFLQKSAQKTFATLGPVGITAADQNETKVFCFFFSKKKCLLPLPGRQHA